MVPLRPAVRSLTALLPCFRCGFLLRTGRKEGGYPITIDRPQGQNIMYTGSYSLEDLKLITSSGVELEALDAHWKMFPDQNLDVAVGHLVGLENGLGQERNEPFTATTDGSEVVIESSEEKLPEQEEAAT